MRVVAQIRQQQLVSLRDVEIDRRRNLAEIPHGLLDAAGHRLSRIEIDRAAVEQHEPEIVIAAKGVIPRQPVDDDRRLLLQKSQGLAKHDLVGAQHPLRVDDGLGIAGRARRQQEFDDRIRTDAPMRLIETRIQRRGQQIGKLCYGTAGQRAAGGHDFDFLGNVGLQRGGELIGVIDEDQSRRQKLHQIRKLAVIPGDQRIGRRHRAERHARHHGTERHQRMVDRVAGQDQKRPFGRKIARQQAGGDATALLEKLGVSDLAPAAVLSRYRAPP